MSSTQEALADHERRLDAIEARQAVLVEVVRALEWKINGTCPVCHGYFQQGHEKGCGLVTLVYPNRFTDCKVEGCDEGWHSEGELTSRCVCNGGVCGGWGLWR